MFIPDKKSFTPDPRQQMLEAQKAKTTPKTGNFLSKVGLGIKQAFGFAPGGYAPIPNPLKIAQSAAEPVLKGAATAVRAVESTPKILGAAGDMFIGKDEKAAENLADAQNIQRKPVFGQKTLAGDTAGGNIGTALNAGSNLIGVKAELPAILNNETVKAGLTGAAQGAAQGAGNYLQSDQPHTLSGFVADTLKGAGTGAITGGLSAHLSPVITGEQKLSDFVKSNYTPSGIKTQLQEKFISGLKDSYDELFGSGKSGAKKLDQSQAQGKDPSQLLAEKGYVVDTQKINGRYQIDSQPTVEKIKTEQITPLEDQLDQILAEKDRISGQNGRINLDDIASEAKQKAATEQAKGSGNLPKIHAEIDGLIADLKTTYGDTVSLTELNQIKKGQWQQVTTFDPTSPKYMGDVNRSVAQSAKVAIENGVPEAAVKKINSKLGDWYDASNNLNRLNGSVVKGGKIGGYTNRVIGAIVGSHFGPLGALAGEHIGSYISDIVQSQTISNPIKKAILESVPKDSEVYTEAQSALKNLQSQPTAQESGTVHEGTIVPADLSENSPYNVNKNSKTGKVELTKKPIEQGVIKVNNYQKEFAKYLTPDQINKAMQMLEAIKQQGKTIDMKAIIKKVKGP